jgi:signal transduction histidine kinase
MGVHVTERAADSRRSEQRFRTPKRVNAIGDGIVEFPKRSGESSAAAALLDAALDDAAADVRDTWRETIADGATTSEVDEHVALLLAAVRLVAAGETPPGLKVLSTYAPARTMLDVLRRSFLVRLTTAPEPPDARQLLHMVRAMSLVEGELERDATQRFIHRLSRPDGLELIVDVAHDLRSPLAAILFLAETLRKAQSGPVNAVQERQLGLVYSAAFGLRSLASDVIELVHGGERLVDSHPIPFSVQECTQSMRDIVQPLAEEKGLHIELVNPEPDFRVGYPSALNRALLNLTTNALKFTSEGQVEVIGRALDRTRVEFSVRDTGRGIPPEVVPTLFETFRRRLKPGEYTFSSAGLGLAIVRKLVAAMGGELKVDTVQERGTRFCFELELPPATRM